MFFRSRMVLLRSLVPNNTFILKFLYRKETLSPTQNIRKEKGYCKQNKQEQLVSPNSPENGGRTIFFTSLRASLTIETAVVFSFFLMCMVAVLQYANVMGVAARLGSALCETSEKMAISAYFTEYGEVNPMISGVVSAAYGEHAVMNRAGNTDSIEKVNFFHSSYLSEADMVHLVMTYGVKMPIGGITLPKVRFIQRASVRGWTGREGSGGTAESDDQEQSEGTKVYVTEYGTVYHKDRNCSHIRLHIRSVSKDTVGGERNRYGAKYKSCEYCGKHAGDTVYITTDGDRYHSTLDCGGLKRTVTEKNLEDLGTMRPCSKCGGS